MSFNIPFVYLKQEDLGYELILVYSPSIIQYNNQTNTNSYIDTFTDLSSDEYISDSTMTDSKFYTLVINSGVTYCRISEYNITTNPFTINTTATNSWTFNVADYPGLDFQASSYAISDGFCMKDNNTILLGAKSFYYFNITGGTLTKQFDLPLISGETATFGEVLYNPTTTRFQFLLITTIGNNYIGEMYLNGTIYSIAQITYDFGTFTISGVTSTNFPTSLFADRGNLYLTEYFGANIFNVDKSNLNVTLEQTMPDIYSQQIVVNGSAQQIKYNNITLNPLQLGYYYHLTQFDCVGGNSCSGNSNTATAYSSTPLTVGNYYSVASNYVWYVAYTVSPTTYDLDFSGYGSGYVNCVDACMF